MWTYLKAVSSGAWNFILPFIQVLLTQAGQVLAQTAMDTVKQVAINYSSAPGAEKKIIAFNLITDSLAKQGIQMGASIINMAIEAAVQKIKRRL